MTIRERRELPIIDRVGGTVVSRRTVARGLAWTTPVVAIATAAPAFAVSGGKVTFTSLGIACKLPGASCEGSTGVNKGYVIRVRVCSTFTFPTEIIVRDATVSFDGDPTKVWQVGASGLSTPCANVTVGTVPDPDGGLPQNEPDLKLTFTSAGCCVIDFSIDGQNDSSNGSINGTAPFTYKVIGKEAEPNGTGSGVVPLTAPATPPCENCAPPPAP